MKHELLKVPLLFFLPVSDIFWNYENDKTKECKELNIYLILNILICNYIFVFFVLALVYLAIYLKGEHMNK